VIKKIKREIMTMIDSSCLMENGGGGGGGGSCLTCTPEEEKQIVEELSREAERDLKEGNLYFVVSSR
jgi:ubiquitin carboxyl-terminal hydrolase 4/11/15